MKKLFLIILMLSLMLSFNCKKQNTQSDSNSTSESVDVVTQYVSEGGVWLYKNKDDIGKKAKDVTRENKMYIEFASQVDIVNKFEAEGKEYYQVQLPDDTKWYAPASSFAEKLIVITQDNVICYKQPAPGYETQIKLQTGDLGIYKKEHDGYISAKFLAYRPMKRDGKKVWLGGSDLWIKGSYTEDLSTAKQAYYLYLAYYFQTKNDNNNAIKNLEKAIDITNGNDTEITYVVEDLLRELKGESDIENDMGDSNSTNGEDSQLDSETSDLQ